MIFARRSPASIALLALAAAGLGGCLGASDPTVEFRDLADIPARPEVTAREINQQAVQSLAEDRARTAQAADRLRSEPFAEPEPAPKRPVP